MAKPFQSFCQQVFYLLQVLIHIKQQIRVTLLVKIRPLIYLKTYMLVAPAACGFCSFTVTVLLVHRHGFNRIIVCSVVYKPYPYTLTAKLRQKTPLFSRAQPLKTRPGGSLVLAIIIFSTPAIACGTYAFMRAISPSVKKPWVALTDLSHISVRVFITPSVLFLTTKIPVILHKQARFLYIIQSKICRKSIARRFDELQAAKITVKINLNRHFKRLSTDISAKARYFFKNPL